MKTLLPSPNVEAWPRKACTSVETRKRDLVIRISDWTRQSPDTGEPAYDVETYVGGVHDFNLSKCCSLREYGTKAAARTAAVEFAQKQIAELL